MGARPDRSTKQHLEPEPLADWSRVGERAHFVQFYVDDGALMDMLTPFIGTALLTGDAGVVIATKRHRDGFEKRLKQRGLDVSVARNQGRYVPLDAAETLAKILRDGWPDSQRFNQVIVPVIERATAATNRVRPRLAAFGEMVALLWKAGKTDAAVRLEELWNDLAQEHSFSLCCAYPMNGFSGGDAASFVQICARHSHVFAAERNSPRSAVFSRPART